MRLVPALVVLSVTHVLFFGDVLFGGRSLSPAIYTSGLTPGGPYGAPSPTAPPHLLDVEGAAWVDEPSPYLAAAAWRTGEAPLWNDAEGLGAPLAANLNSGAGNPLQLPLALRPGPLAADLFALARLLLLAVGTACYLGELTVMPVAALAGGALVAYGGYATAWIVHHPLSAELFLPFMLLAVERARRRARGGWSVLALAIAGSFLGGKLQASLLCVALVGAYAGIRAPRRAGGAGVATFACTAVAAMLGVGLAAYLLVPAAELIARASGLTLGGRSALAGWVLPAPTLAAVALPRLFVPAGHAFAPGLPLPPAIGLVATVLAVVGARARRSPLHGVARLFAAVAVIVLARNAGLLGAEWMTAVPVVRGIFFLKYTFVAAFALAVLAAIGIDALARGLVRPRETTAALAGTVAILGVLLVAAAFRHLLVGRLDAATTAASALGVLVLAAPARARPRGAVAAVLLAIAVVLELRALAPSAHPPRVDPYRPPPYVAFLRAAPAARVLAADGLMPPLTSGAAGLRDLRSIDVLTPGTSYAFFVRLVSFCARIVHFTVDPDLPLAATAPAVDLAGVRWIVSRGDLDAGDLDARVARHVGEERVARLLAGLRGIRTEDAALALGTVETDGARRFAFSFATPFTLDLTAETEAPELAWDLHVAGGAARLTWHVVSSVAADPAPRGAVTVPDAAGWHPLRLGLGAAGTLRRVRVRLRGESAETGAHARVDLGDLGFTEGEAAEAARTVVATAQHRAELAALVPVFRDDATGAVVYENRNALPRAFRRERLEPVASVEAALTRLADGFDFRAAALVGGDAGVLARAERTALSLAPAPLPDVAGARSPFAGATVLVKGDPAAVTVATDGDATALVVVGDLDFPGWRAVIDGEAAPIVTTDGVLRGVLVPPGPHCVELRYAPASLAWGLAATVLAGALLVPFARRAARAHAKIVPPFRPVV